MVISLSSWKFPNLIRYITIPLVLINYWEVLIKGFELLHRDLDFELCVTSWLTRLRIWRPLAEFSGRLCWGCSVCSLRCTLQTCTGTPPPADTAWHTRPSSRCCWSPCGWIPPATLPPLSRRPSLALPGRWSQTCSVSCRGGRASRRSSHRSPSGAELCGRRSQWRLSSSDSDCSGSLETIQSHRQLDSMFN